MFPERITDEPGWPDAGDGPVVFLTDASSRFERRLLHDWVERHRPDGPAGSDVTVTSIPRTRRRRPGDWVVNPKLRARLAHEDDPLLVPLRVVWLAPERDGQRRASWLDLLKLGDPRDPDPVRQRWFVITQPDRCRIVMGDPAREAHLRSRWLGGSADADLPPVTADDVVFEEYVALQAQLALERAERRLRGSRYKVPMLVRDELLARRSTRARLTELANEIGEQPAKVAQRAARYLKEIAASHSPYVIDLLALAIRTLLRRAYGTELRYDRAELKVLYEMGQRHPLVFLPSHKSQLDHLVLQLVLWENGLPQNHTAGGINLNFFPVGQLVRRAGVFFIRRSFKDNEVYKLVLRLYIAYLLEKRFSLEWYIEGGRSRSGKLRAPRFGMLNYVYEAWEAGASENVVLIPVSIAYDQQFDLSDYAREQRGESKRGESVRYVVDSVRRLGRPHGSVHLRFGRPLSLRDERRPGGADADRQLAVQKLAFDVAVRINEVTPITPISLVTLALLGTRDRALSIDETLRALEPYLDYVKRQELPTTEPLQLDTPERVQEALDALAAGGVVSRYDAGPEPVYAIGADQELAAAYYRNTIIHFFVDAAIVELSLAAAARGPEAECTERFWEEVRRLRDLLKFEFFFPRRDEYPERLAEELATSDPEWRTRLAAGDAQGLLRAARPLTAHWVLRPFLEAYLVVADALERHPPDTPVAKDEFIAEALALGRQYYLQRRIHSGESVSVVLFGTALELAANRGLLEPGSAVAEGRRTLAAEIRAGLHQVDAVEALAAGQATGLVN